MAASELGARMVWSLSCLGPPEMERAGLVLPWPLLLPLLLSWCTPQAHAQEDSSEILGTDPAAARHLEKVGVGYAAQRA